MVQIESDDATNEKHDSLLTDIIHVNYATQRHELLEDRKINRRLLVSIRTYWLTQRT